MLGVFWLVRIKGKCIIKYLEHIKAQCCSVGKKPINSEIVDNNNVVTEI